MDESVQKHLAEVEIGTLRLSSAIRIGATLRPQCFGYSAVDGGSCALTAGAEALGLRYHGHLCLGTVQTFLASRGLALDEVTRDEIVHRNDAIKQSRESIADWLEERGQ